MKINIKNLSKLKEHEYVNNYKDTYFKRLPGYEGQERVEIIIDPLYDDRPVIVGIEEELHHDDAAYAAIEDIVKEYNLLLRLGIIEED